MEPSNFMEGARMGVLFFTLVMALSVVDDMCPNRETGRRVYLFWLGLGASFFAWLMGWLA